MCVTACRRCRRRWNEAVRGKENRIAIYCLFLLHLIEVGWPKQRKNNAAGGKTNKKHVWEKQAFGGIFEFAKKRTVKTVFFCWIPWGQMEILGRGSSKFCGLTTFFLCSPLSSLDAIKSFSQIEAKNGNLSPLFSLFHSWVFTMWSWIQQTLKNVNHANAAIKWLITIYEYVLKTKIYAESWRIPRTFCPRGRYDYFILFSSLGIPERKTRINNSREEREKEANNE